MKTIRRLFVITVLSIIIYSCSTQHVKDNIISIWINSELVDCVGVAPMKCMQIQESDTIKEEEWKFFYSKIEGFEFEEGYIYHLKVKKEELDLETVPADAPSIKYTLVEQLSKEKVPACIEGEWQLISINMKTLSINDEKKIPHLMIDGEFTEIVGFSGCNRLKMSYELSGENGIKLNQGILTRMACPDPNYEHDFMQALNKVVNYSLSDTNLVFYDIEGAELLNFSRK